MVQRAGRHPPVAVWRGGLRTPGRGQCPRQTACASLQVSPRALSLFLECALPSSLCYPQGGSTPKEELRTMRRLFAMCGALLLAALLTPAQQGLTLQVQLHYTGSGTVDETHKIFVALWDSASFTGDGGGPPVAVQATTSKNGTVTFSDIQKVPVYASAAYDPTGQWDAQSPPPAGSSLGMYTKAPPKPEPINIEPGKTTKVTISFDDSNKVK